VARQNVLAVGQTFMGREILAVYHNVHRSVILREDGEGHRAVHWFNADHPEEAMQSRYRMDFRTATDVFLERIDRYANEA
jgi:hypothetical protein